MKDWLRVTSKGSWLNEGREQGGSRARGGLSREGEAQSSSLGRPGLSRLNARLGTTAARARREGWLVCGRGLERLLQERWARGEL